MKKITLRPYTVTRWALVHNRQDHPCHYCVGTSKADLLAKTCAKGAMAIRVTVTISPVERKKDRP